MSANSLSTFFVAPLRKLVASPVTDPTEQAALENLLQKNRENLPDRTDLVIRVTSLCQRLPVEDRFLPIAQVAPLLSSEEYLNCFEALLAKLPSGVLEALEKKSQDNWVRVEQDSRS